MSRLRSQALLVVVVALVSWSRLACVPPCEVVVVRHGETDWNRELRVQGRTDIPLNDKGRLQALRCAQVLAGSSGGVIYSSRLQRASATASAIAKGLAEAGVEVIVQLDERLNEWDLGVIEGLRKTEAAERHKEDWDIFSQWCEPHASEADRARPISGGESMDSVRLRAVACLEEACSRHRQVIAVTHGGVLGQLLKHAEFHNNNTRRWPMAANACISRFLVRPGGRWEVLSWADTSHLTGEDAPIAADYSATASR